MLKINDNKGFHLTFDNGYTVSVQFGPSNYCENRHIPFVMDRAVPLSSHTAVIAVWNSDGVWHTKRAFRRIRKLYDDVAGWCPPSEVARIIARVSKWKK